MQTVVEHVRLGKSEVEQHSLKRDSSRGAVDVDAVKLLGEDARPKDTVKDFMDGSLAVPGSLETALVLKGSGGGARRDVEEVLYENNKVLEVAVVGISNQIVPLTSDLPADGAIINQEILPTDERQRGQKIKAFVVPRPGVTLTKEELLTLCRKRLDAYAVPWEIEFRQELPKSFVGKVLRRVLVQNQDDAE